MTILQFIIVALAIQGTSPMTTFQFTRGVKLNKYIGFRVNVPSLYQCAEVCLSLKLCKSLNFDKANKKCHISINTWNINVLTANKDFLYAEKDDIPQVSRTIVNYIEYHYINARETRRENYEWAIPWYTDNIRNKTQNKDKWKTPHRKMKKMSSKGARER